MKATVLYEADDIKRLVCREILTKYGVKVTINEVYVSVHTRNGEPQPECVVDISQAPKARP